MQIPQTRKIAIEIGSKYYFTNKKCPKGHINYRRIHNGECIDCRSISSRKRMALIPKEKKDEYRKKTRQKQKSERNKANLERGYALKDIKKGSQ